MNLVHRLVCRSAPWGWMVGRWVIPWALDGLDPGEHVLELGPGPGLTTDVLRERTARLTAVELDPRLASSLQERMKNTNVEVVETDATAMPFPAGSFSAVLSFTMLHHVPSVTLRSIARRGVARVASGRRIRGVGHCPGRSFAAGPNRRHHGPSGPRGPQP
jgi:SAM-dependent methyltransferase